MATKRPLGIRRMSRAKLERIARLARECHRIDGGTAWASDRRAILLELWGVEAIDGPHGRCPRCREMRTEPNRCATRGCNGGK